MFIIILFIPSRLHFTVKTNEIIERKESNDREREREMDTFIEKERAKRDTE